ncbi:hypothetical protein J7E79_30535 [Bacillus sp. ISL-40]|uniref:hypothetical protein n=1 Tax=unclassified Bacillus (in: firmicutes) TaxID=185979 RepID=UPI001BE5C597|nr:MULTISPECIES: hypothetical protein [unclassified Bacillus (in: firmicutes)]MBT2701588.1 hypothetical protein [Bacillus sp. ISL-40]MBT2744705.1 hypothetical protein [Bacillus sp. ISL-77]
MQNSKARELQEEWKEEGDKSCSHPQIVKEYYYSAQTSDYVCTTCGYEGTKEIFEKLRKQSNTDK